MSDLYEKGAVNKPGHTCDGPFLKWHFCFRGGKAEAKREKEMLYKQEESPFEGCWWAAARGMAGYIQRALTGPWGGAAKVIDTSGLSSWGSLTPPNQPALVSFSPVSAAKKSEAFSSVTGVKRSPNNS